MTDFFTSYKQFIIFCLRHCSGDTFNAHIRTPFIAERKVKSCIIHMECYHFFFAVMQWRIRYMYRCYRLQSVDSIGYVPLRFVAYFLSDDFPLVIHSEQHRATFSVKKGAKRFHTTLQLTGGFLKLHPSVFLFGYQLFYYIEIVYTHIQFVTIMQR